MDITPQNELNMLRSFINALPNSPTKKQHEELYQTKKKALNKTKKNLNIAKKKSNNAAANAFLLNVFGTTTGRTHSPIIKHSSKPNMPTRNLPPLPPGVKGGLRKRKTRRR